MKYTRPHIERTKLVGTMIDKISVIVCDVCLE